MRLLFAAIVFAYYLSASMSVQTAQNHGLDLVLPTDNDALFSGDGPAFYQYIERDYQGVKSTPWEGGQYGFVRDPKDTGRRRLHSLSRRNRHSLPASRCKRRTARRSARSRRWQSRARQCRAGLLTLLQIRRD